MPQTQSNPASAQQFQPSVVELAGYPCVEMILERLSHLPGCLLLDSAMKIESSSAQPLGRYSFLMADPIETIVEPVGSKSVFERIKKCLAKYTATTMKGLPPMQGGIAGLFSYDLNRSIEKIEAPKFDEFKLPAVALGVYDVVIAWDHQEEKTWIISQGLPELEPAARKKRADLRVEYFKSLIGLGGLSNGLQQQLTPQNELAPMFDVEGPEQLTSNFSKPDYLEAVQKSIEYIYAGDIFQVNLAQRLTYPANCDSIELFKRLRSCNPSPFASYFDLSQMADASGFGNFAAQIISASPERLFSVRDRMVETRPIKGTRRRTGRPMVDIQAKETLLASEKDRAENTMIVDLMRNDLSRVCEDDSICVTQLCELEEFKSVLHLVSAVEGRLKPDANSADLLEAVFPGGSITGAPKVRAMEIISELEPTARGAYCGSVGYLGFDGNADLNILIRTITASQGWWQIPVGGGIVSQSQPAKEYEETWTKAAGMLRAVTMHPSQIRKDKPNT